MIKRQSLGFTLIEVLVVVAIIALLISILLPSLKKAREQAKTATCLSQLRQIGKAVGMYTSEFDDSLPANGLNKVGWNPYCFCLASPCPRYADYRGGFNWPYWLMRHKYLSDGAIFHRKYLIVTIC